MGGAASVLLALGLAAPAPVMAEQDGSNAPSDKPVSLVVDETFAPNEIGASLTPADGNISTLEDAAVESYLESQNDDAVLQAQDLQVGTLNSGDLNVTVVAPDHGVSVDEIRIGTTGPNDLSIGAKVAAAGPPPATSTGPTMGTWPNWSASWHGSVQLNLYYYSDYLGRATFQTYKRKMQNDGNSGVTGKDYWQVARHAVAVPGNWDSFGPDGDMEVQRLWASQDLKNDDQRYAREWMWPYTNPEAGFNNCAERAMAIGPWSVGITNCEDYHVWTGGAGDIGHQRMYMDQGAVVGGGNRALAYVSGFSMYNNVHPNFTWYEFVTLQKPDGIDFKCPSNSRGPQDDTEIEKCTWVQG